MASPSTLSTRGLGRTPEWTRAASSTSRWAFVRVTRARARACRAAARRAHAGIVFSRHKSSQSVPLKRRATSGQFETRSEQGTHSGGEAPGAHATDSPKIARRSSAKAQMAFFDERRSYVTVRQVPPNFSQYLSKKSWRCSFCSACFVAHAYAFDGSM